jgi:peptidoglycan-associated lipoprotein
MKKVSILVLVLAFGLILSSCAERKIVQPEPKQQPVVTTPETKERAPEVKAEKKIPEEKVTEQQLAKVETKEVEKPKYVEEKDVLQDIYFDFDKYDIRPDAKPVLQKIASRLLKDTSFHVLTEGHCDERGTNEYNLALGDRRVKAVKDYLVALGIASSRIETISYGEEKPLCTEKTEDCWQKNRRAHFVILKKKGR